MNTSNIETREVLLGNRSYPIYIGSGLLKHPHLIQSHMPDQQLMVITNITIAPLYLSNINSKLNFDKLILPDGEQYKTIETLNNIFNYLIEKKHDRKTLLCALGGGVIGDMTGFAAACYRRGVDYIQIPTTLLSQVDAAIGGKTAVNHPMGKNMIGAIYQPRAVIIDLETLDTLPEREYVAGLAEVIKYGLLADVKFFEFLEANIIPIRKRDKAILKFVVVRCCEIKAKIIVADEFERGERALLNLGHTFAHALEAMTHYEMLLHGEAVAIGIVFAAKLSQSLGFITKQDVDRIEVLLLNFRLPIRLPLSINADELLPYMRIDKKVFAKKLRLIVLKQMGEAIIMDNVSEKEIANCLAS